MKKAGYNGKEMADKLDWSDTRVSRVLTGTRGAKEVDIAAFLAICGVVGKERDRLLRLCHDQHQPGWFQQHGSRLPKQLKTLIDHENRAVAISEFQSTLIPGLLQTGDYARAVICASEGVPANEVDDRVAAKLGRKNLMSRGDQVRFRFFIHEFALQLPVGSAEVMSDQLHSLLRDGVRPNISIRLIPAVLGAHAGSAGSFKMMEFGDFNTVTYLDSETSCLFLETPAETAAYTKILAALDSTALDERESKQLIATVAIDLYSDRGDQDASG